MIAYDALPKGHRVAWRFLIDAWLGRGRSAAVYRALDLETETVVALKILDPLLAADSVAVERFVREARILRTLNHPNIIKVYDLLRDGDTADVGLGSEPWTVICMEYFDGLDGKSYLERYGRLSLAEFMPLAKTLVSAVGACHRLKVVHRDLKPQNLLINANHDVKIVDFGISKMNSLPDLTRTGTVFGTPQYLAPELFRSSRADPRSDLYALGAIFYELLAGRPPYVAGSLSAIMTLQAAGPPQPLQTLRAEVPSWLAAIIAKCLRVDPGSRYQSCYEVQRDIERGARAQAYAEARQQHVPCAECGRDLLPRLPFCHHCGHYRHITYARGGKCLVLERCGDLPAFQGLLQRTLPSGGAPRKGRALQPPAVLLRGVSVDTAAAVAQQLSAVPCELRITGHLATRVDLRLMHVTIAFGLLAFLFLRTDNTSAVHVMTKVAATMLVILALYWSQTRPLIDLRPHSPAPSGGIGDPTLRDMCQRLQAISDENLKVILAHIVRSFVVLRESILRTTSIFAVAGIADIVRAAFEGARVIEEHEVYLSLTNHSDLQAKLRAVEAQLQRTSAAAPAGDLIAMKSVCRRELENYQRIQEVHSATYLALVNLQSVLTKVEDTIESGATDAALRTELSELLADLRPEGPSLRN